MIEGLSSKCVVVVCGNTIQDGWLAASGEKYSLRVLSALVEVLAIFYLCHPSLAKT